MEYNNLPELAVSCRNTEADVPAADRSAQDGSSYPLHGTSRQTVDLLHVTCDRPYRVRAPRCAAPTFLTSRRRQSKIIGAPIRSRRLEVISGVENWLTGADIMLLQCTDEVEEHLRDVKASASCRSRLM